MPTLALPPAPKATNGAWPRWLQSGTTENVGQGWCAPL
jgi:hypothetical protein